MDHLITLAEDLLLMARSCGSLEGAGLGLAIARSIVLAHRGAITVTGGQRAGSRFTIALPFA